MMTDKLREQLKHSVSHCTMDGRLWPNPIQRENLFQVLEGMERYIVDSNSNWKAESKEPRNKDVAFIIGRTVDTEEDNLKGLLFSPKVDVTNNNIFGFGLEDVAGLRLVALHRLDRYFKLIFDPVKLDEESKPRTKRTNVENVLSEKRAIASIEQEKSVILDILGVHRIADLPERKALANKERDLLGCIRSNAIHCRYNWKLSVEVARRCYALLLIQQRRMRSEFALPGYRNVFGDMTLVQNGIFLRAGILSADKAPKTMLSYTGLTEVVCRKSLTRMAT